MSLEDSIFKRSKPDIDKLIDYGFVLENKKYKYEVKFLNDMFLANIVIDDNLDIHGKVFDLDTNLEYVLLRVESNNSSFVSNVRSEYLKILKDICNNCFINNYFIYEQSNRITKFIHDEFLEDAEFLWKKYPGFGVFRNKINKKWYALIANISKSKLGSNDIDEVEIINVKVNPDDIYRLLEIDGIYEGYHMNKKNWVSIILDDSLNDDFIIDLVIKSRDYSLRK